jgi:peptidoglycan/xylan/chitin deacetylase (PgdA/CDA1 family)
MERFMKSSSWRSAAFLGAAGLALPIALVIAHAIPDDTEPARPIDNDCSAGYVEFTVDDGPSAYTPKLLDKLNALNLKATFFVIGKNIDDGGPKAAALMRASVKAGHSVQNHTYDHASITGESTKKAPLTKEQIVQELDRGTRSIVAAGLPRPTLYRPPYGDIDARADDLARELGYRLVSPWGVTDSNIVDSKDWSGASTERIVSNVINGYTSDGYRLNGIKDRTIVTMHDGDSLASIAALQPIVDYMNVHHLCSTTAVRDDALGGRVPAPPLPEPGAGNLVRNPSLEKRRGDEPACFQHAEDDTVGIAAQWSRVSDAHTGTAAEQVIVPRSAGGDRKLLISRNPSGSACLAKVKSGTRYGTWLWYKGDWTAEGAAKTEVSMVLYYRRSSGDWKYWQTGPPVEPSSTWKLTNFVTASLPRDATAISFGLEISGAGILITDDYSMAAQ